MQCVICSREFEGRADAKFCSASCRVKGSRMEKANAIEASKILENGFVAPAPEKEKKTLPNLDELGHLRPSQTQAEYIANIPERGYLADGSKCTHPLEEHFHSRCLQCMEIVPMVTRVRKSLSKESDKKKK